MTPMETIARNVTAICSSALPGGIPVECPLIDALEGVAAQSAPTGVSVSVFAERQHDQPIDTYDFSVPVSLRVSLADDASGTVFAAAYNALFAALFAVTQGDGNVTIGGEGDAFACDGATLSCDSPDLVEAGEEMFYSVTFTLALVGRVTIETTQNNEEAT